jgi:porphobilinogen synthase
MKRLQRNRASAHIRNLGAERPLRRSQLIQPLFVVEGITSDEEIPGLRGNRRLTAESALKQVELDLESGVTQFILFTIPAKKVERNISAPFAAQVISSVKEKFGNDLALWVDTCLCSFTSHGHCCVFGPEGKTAQEETLKELSNLALSYLQAGADGVSPSDMIDGRVLAIREKLDRGGFELSPIMSYSTKFASNFYGPFRVAADSAPQFGDRKQYQIDVRNRRDSLAASKRCAEEGADFLMVKPGMTSIDLIAPISEITGLPVGAYQVSGEFASLALLAKEGLMNFDAGLMETWNVFARAGAQFLITYGARDAKRLGIGE